MTQRRSLTDALELTPDKLAFIIGSSGEKPRTNVVPDNSPLNVPASDAEQEAVPVEESNPTTNVAFEPARRQRRPKSVIAHSLSTINKAPENHGVGMTLGNVLVPLTTRLHPETALALKRASLEQRLRGLSPATVQEIVEQSLTHWLQSHGYLQPL